MGSIALTYPENMNNSPIAILVTVLNMHLNLIILIILILFSGRKSNNNLLFLKKRIIVDEQPKLFKSFLNVLMPFVTGQYIISLEYLQAEQVSDNPAKKDSIVDVRCKDNL
jgi:hypothetical protein